MLNYSTLFLNSETSAYKLKPNDKINQLTEKDEIKEIFKFQVKDEHNASSNLQELNVTVQGANDRPELDPIPLPSDEEYHFVYTDTEKDDEFESFKGTLNASDRDSGDVITYSVDRNIVDSNEQEKPFVDDLGSDLIPLESNEVGYNKKYEGSFGDLHLDTKNGKYKYIPDNELNAIDSLESGQIYQESFRFAATDKSDSKSNTFLKFKFVGADEVANINNQNGYLAGALIFSDVNRNGLLDWTDTNANEAWDKGEGESWTTTDQFGNARFIIGYDTAPLVSIGGINTSTGQAYRSSLTAPRGSTIISPVTTLVESLIANNLLEVTDPQSQKYKSLVNTAEQQIIQALDLPKPKILISFILIISRLLEVNPMEKTPMLLCLLSKPPIRQHYGNGI